MNRKKLKIGLFGFGCVGYGLYEVIAKTPGLKADIKKICVKNRNKKRPLPDENFTFDKDELLEDEEINVIVELIDDADAAFEIVSAALRKGRAVVSANKKMIASHFDELLELQNKYNAPLLYEAACCASIPVIRNLEEYYDNDLLSSIEGIVNGSTNYILTKTSAQNLSYDEALKDAQEKGYAETNPLLDTGGFDAKYKLILLLIHAFGAAVKPEAVFNLGINRLGEPELKYAKEKGLKIKLVASARKNDSGKIGAYVLPRFVSADDKLFSVDDVFNGVKIQSAFSDSQFFMGRGAGAHPTASAVLSDISALSYDYRYEYKKLGQSAELLSEDEILLKVLLRINGKAEEIRHHFISVEEVHSSKNASHVTGITSLSKIRQLTERYDGPELSCVLIDDNISTEDATVADLQSVEWK